MKKLFGGNTEAEPKAFFKHKARSSFMLKIRHMYQTLDT